MKRYKHMVMVAVEVESDNEQHPSWEEGIAGLKQHIDELEASTERGFFPVDMPDEPSFYERESIARDSTAGYEH